MVLSVPLLTVRSELSNPLTASLKVMVTSEVSPTLIAATKVDKLTRSEAPKRLRELALAIGVEDEQIIPFSSVTGMGRDDLAAAVVALVGEPPWRYRVSNPATY